MNTFKHMTLLEIVEEFASVNDLVESEEHLSEMFDDEVAPSVIAKYGENDQPAMSGAFNDYKDHLQREGRLHELQVNAYCYTGEYSTD